MQTTAGIESKKTCVFSEDMSKQEFKLLDLPDELLARILSEDEDEQQIIFTLKGLPDAHAVLCTEDSTYSITKVETTNTLLLVSPTLNSFVPTLSIDGTADAHFEAARTTPLLLQQLPNFLPFYHGTKAQKVRPNEKTRNTKLHTLEQLECQLQASRLEILSALRKLNAVQVDGFWLQVDPIELQETFEMILLDIDANAWPLSNISEQQCLDSLENVDPFIVKHALQIYSSSMDKETKFYTLDFEKIAIFKALLLFSSSDKWRTKDFIESWNDCMSSFVKREQCSMPSIELLTKNGLCVVELQNNNDSQLKVLNRNTLPIDPKQRFQLLFQAKKKWAISELQIYLQDLLCVGSQTLDGLLTKFARAIQSGGIGEKMYTNK